MLCCASSSSSSSSSSYLKRTLHELIFGVGGLLSFIRHHHHTNNYHHFLISRTSIRRQLLGSGLISPLHSNTLSTLQTTSRLVTMASLTDPSSTPVVAANVAVETAEDVVGNLRDIDARISQQVERLQLKKRPVLVAVSKTKPISLIKACYEQGHRDFGENYAQELMTKAEELRSVCPEIRWHFIGHLQENKAKKLVKVVGEQLHSIETVDSQKLAKTLDKAVLATRGTSPLRVLIQVNTSGEESKSGVAPDDVASLADFIMKETPRLKLAGLMTIGQYEPNPNNPDDQPDFVALSRCREKVASALGVEVDTLELSMGMSHDFEKAIQFGSTSVRVGSSIFGKRVRTLNPQHQ